MARFYDLLKSRTIDFNKLLLDQYIKLGLDEIDYVILSKLYFDLQTGNEYLDAEKLCSTMSISKETCSERIVSLVNRGFISLELSSISAKEVYSLNDLFEKLDYLLEGKPTDNSNQDIKDIVKILEREIKSVLSPLDLQIVSKWFYDYKYSKEEIERAIYEAKLNKTRGVQYVDRYLYKNNIVTCNQPKVDNELTNLFGKIYDKK